MEQFISKEILDELSYTSTLGQSLKQISLSQTPLEKIIQDIGKYRANYVDILIQENLIGSRFKSDDSIYRKYEKTLRNHGGFKQCFNDVLGFRLRMDDRQRYGFGAVMIFGLMYGAIGTSISMIPLKLEE